MKNTLFFSTGMLSQFWLSDFSVLVDGTKLEFNCAEQWHHYHKALLSKNTEWKEKILNCKYPSKQKELGRSIPNFNNALWEKERLDIITRGNIEKFSQNKSLLKYLLFLLFFLLII